MIQLNPPTGSQSNDRLNSHEAAAFLLLKPQTLENWRCQRRNQIPFIKVGSRVQYRRADLEAFLASRTVGVSAVAE